MLLFFNLSLLSSQINTRSPSSGKINGYARQKSFDLQTVHFKRVQVGGKNNDRSYLRARAVGNQAYIVVFGRNRHIRCRAEYSVTLVGYMFWKRTADNSRPF